MNILVVSSMFPNKYFPTNGIFVQEQCKALVSQGLKITVIAPIPFVFPGLGFFSDKWRKFSQISYKENISGIQVLRPRFIAIPGGKLKQHWYKVLYHLSKRKIFHLHKKENFDLIHVHGSAPADYAGYLYSKKLNIPYILTIHGESVQDLAFRGNRFRSTKIAIEKANAVIGVSSKIVKQTLHVTNKKENVVRILNGYTPYNLNKINKLDSSYNILFAGNLKEQKGVWYLIKAFSKIADDNDYLHIVGDGEQRKRLEQLVTELKISKNVRFYGYLEHEKLMVEMQKCDVFIMPSWNEAFGIVYLEAMSLQKPIIGTKREGIEDIIIDNENGILVEPKNINSIAKKLKLLRDDEAFRNLIAKKGFETAKKLTWEFNSKETIKIYNEVLKF